MLDHSCQIQPHKLCKRKHDLYETPACAVTALLQHETLPIGIWEPACGRGAIADILTAHGHKVCSSDLIDYGKGYAGIDFLTEQKMPDHCTAIVTNPPFKLAYEFVKHGLQLCPQVYTLHRFAFYESQRRSDLFDYGMLKHVYCFKKRLPMMHRDGWTGRKASSAMAFAWFVWDRQYQGPTILSRIDW